MIRNCLSKLPGIIVGCLVCFFDSGPLHAQQVQTLPLKRKVSRTYIQFDAGYRFAQAGQTEFDYQYINGSGHYGNITDASFHNYSLGKGTVVRLGLGRQLNPFFGVEIGGSATLVRGKYTYTDEPRLPDNSTESYTIVTSAKPVYVTLSATGQTRFRRLNAYSRLGIAAPVSNGIVQSITGSKHTHLELEYKAKFSLGIQGAVGISYTVYRGINLCLEMTGISRNAYATARDITEYNVSISARHVDYNFTSSSNGLTAPTFVIPFSNVGGSVGLKLEI